MIALILHRNGETSIAQQIIQSIGENLVRQGNHLAYSKNNGYHWYNNSLETQALLIEGLPVEDPIAYTNAVCNLMAPGQA